MLQALERHTDPRGARIVDIGGACTVIAGQLASLGEFTLVEPDEETARQARQQLGVEVAIGGLPDLPASVDHCDIVTLLDVLEHIDDDHAALVAIRRVLVPGGILVCTVPAYQLLWSEHDEALHHKRRYRRRQLQQRLEAAGFEVLTLTSYTTALLPLVAGQRLASRLRHREGPPQYRVTVPGPVTNRLLGSVMTLERVLLRHISLPVGSSILAVARTHGRRQS